MQKLKTIAICLVATLPLFNCAHKPKFEKVKNDVFAELQAKKKKLNDKGVIAEVAIAESRSLQTGIDKVELEARGKLSRSLESKTSTLQKKFQEEVGREFSDHFSQVVKTISDQMLHGTSLQETRFEQNEEGVYRVYGLMTLDSDLYLKALTNEMDADKANRDRFRASKAYKELNDEVAAYQAWKQQEAAPQNHAPTAPVTVPATSSQTAQGL
jgi:hypothetical protein